MMSKTETKPWSLFTDGASNVNGTCLGLVLKSPQGGITAHAICCDFKATNNEAEYEALIIGLTTARDLKATHIDVNCDSLLISNHVNGTYKAKDYKMLTYLNIVKELQAEFDSFNIQQVLRESNTQTDALAGLGAIFRHINLTTIPIIHILKPAIDKLDNNKDVLHLDNIVNDNTQQSMSWTHTIKDYLTNDVQPVNNIEAEIFRIKASRFVLIDDVLFKKSATCLLQRCLEMEETQQVLQDIHEGDCGNHSRGRNLSFKVLRMGYYWPTLRQDALNYVKKCDACQRHASIIHQPSEYLHPSTPSCPFIKWGMDIVGKMPQAPDQKVCMLAMTDYFSKWIEVEAFRHVKSKEVISFIKSNILCKFGVLSEIVFDNGSQFISDKMEAFCHQWKITLVKSTPRYPQANGQAESSNKIIINNLKKRLTTHKG